MLASLKIRKVIEQLNVSNSCLQSRINKQLFYVSYLK